LLSVEAIYRSAAEKAEAVARRDDAMDVFIFNVHSRTWLSPSSHAIVSTVLVAEYHASRKHVETVVDVPNELPESEDAHELSAAVSTLSVSSETLVAHGAKKGSVDLTASRVHSDASSIDALVMLRPEILAMVNRLLQLESNANYDLHYSSNSGRKVQHESLKRLGPRRWLNDELINDFNAYYLGPKLEDHSYILQSHFMSALLDTGLMGQILRITNIQT
jgi:hypothetical protein